MMETDLEAFVALPKTLKELEEAFTFNILTCSLIDPASIGDYQSQRWSQEGASGVDLNYTGTSTVNSTRGFNFDAECVKVLKSVTTVLQVLRKVDYRSSSS
jgi:hypothetical protein